MMTEFTIGRVARATGCKVPTIRYYEQIGLLPRPLRSSGDTRLYSAEDVARIGFIQHCRELGFPQSSIRELLELSDHPDHSCAAVSDIAQAHLQDVKRRIAQLTTLEVELENMIEICAGGRVEQCRIVEALTNYERSDAE